MASKALALITARGGSKRIPRKNIRDFHGKPIIAYPIKAAIDSGIFAEVMVSTDNAEIAQIAQAHGAKVPFLRSAENSTDAASPLAVFREVLEAYLKLGTNFSHFSCIHPTGVFATPELFREAFRQQLAQDADSVITVNRFEAPVQRALKLENGFLSMREPQFMKVMSQELQPAFYDCSQFFICKTESFNRTGIILTEKSIPIHMPSPFGQDVDNEEDWELAELKFELMQRRKLNARA
jgi:pseudaminic acid cytidylyltransferase